LEELKALVLYCPLIEKEVRLRGKPVGKHLFLPEECSEAGCPVRLSVNCMLLKVVQVQ